MQYGRHICSRAYASNVECMYTSAHGHNVHLHWIHMKYVVFEGHICCGTFKVIAMVSKVAVCWVFLTCLCSNMGSYIHTLLMQWDINE